MQEGQLLLCSFSSVDIGFPSTFADTLISLEVCRRIYHCKIQVKGLERLLGQTPWFFFYFHIRWLALKAGNTFDSQNSSFFFALGSRFLDPSRFIHFVPSHRGKPKKYATWPLPAEALGLTHMCSLIRICTDCVPVTDAFKKPLINCRH